MNIGEAEHLVEAVWERVKPAFLQNIPSERIHSWEQSDEASLADLDEYFWGSSYRFAMLAARLSAYLPHGAKVLDAGAGHGLLAVSLKQAGFDVAATDLHKGLKLFEAEGIPYKSWHLEAEAAPFDNNMFDAMVLSQTIEHFTYSPLWPLQEMVRITKPGGILLIDAPNIACFHNIYRLLRGKTIHWEMKKHYLEQMPEEVNGVPYYDRHNHEYCRQDLLDIADYFGLTVEEVTYYSSYNRRKRGMLAILASQLRDSVRRWRKGIYAVYRLPSRNP